MSVNFVELSKVTLSLKFWEIFHQEPLPKIKIISSIKGSLKSYEFRKLVYAKAGLLMVSAYPLDSGWNEGKQIFLVADILLESRLLFPMESSLKDIRIPELVDSIQGTSLLTKMHKVRRKHLHKSSLLLSWGKLGGFSETPPGQPK